MRARIVRPATVRPRTLLRWAGRVAAGAYGASEYRLRERFAAPTHAPRVPDGAGAAALAARGRRLTAVRGCVDCHGAGLDGRVFLDAPPVGRIVAPNLTRGGRGAALTDADWERAVRHGGRRDGSGLLVMPSDEFAVVSDEDLTAVMAYARSLPTRRTALPPRPYGSR